MKPFTSKTRRSLSQWVFYLYLYWNTCAFCGKTFQYFTIKSNLDIDSFVCECMLPIRIYTLWNWSGTRHTVSSLLSLTTHSLIHWVNVHKQARHTSKRTYTYRERDTDTHCDPIGKAHAHTPTHIHLHTVRLWFKNFILSVGSIQLSFRILPERKSK